MSKDTRIALGLALFGVSLFMLTGWGHPAYYDYFAPLARALLAGHWWLDAPDPLLHELLPCGIGRYCVVYVPLPAFVVLPFTLLFDNGVAQQLASSFAGGVAAAPIYLALRRLQVPVRSALALSVFMLAGTSLYFAATDGRAWSFAHAVGICVISFALLSALSGACPWLIGALAALAALARVPLALAFPGLVWLFVLSTGMSWRRALLGVIAGALPFALLEVGYDLLRWGVPWERGYGDLAGGEIFYQHGMFSIAYLPRHLYALFLQMPEFVGDTLFFLKPTWAGTAVSLMSPALFYVVPACKRLRTDGRVGALLLCGLGVFVPDVLHGNVGWTQIGYRFIIDPLPFFVVLIGLGVCSNRPNALPRGLLAAILWSVSFSTYVTLAVKWFDYVEMRYPSL